MFPSDRENIRPNRSEFEDKLVELIKEIFVLCEQDLLSWFGRERRERDAVIRRWKWSKELLRRREWTQVTWFAFSSSLRSPVRNLIQHKDVECRRRRQSNEICIAFYRYHFPFRYHFPRHRKSFSIKKYEIEKRESEWEEKYRMSASRLRAGFIIFLTVDRRKRAVIWEGLDGWWEEKLLSDETNRAFLASKALEVIRKCGARLKFIHQ